MCCGNKLRKLRRAQMWVRQLIRKKKGVHNLNDKRGGGSGLRCLVMMMMMMRQLIQQYPITRGFY